MPQVIVALCLYQVIALSQGSELITRPNMAAILEPIALLSNTDSYYDVLIRLDHISVPPTFQPGPFCDNKIPPKSAA